jgi:hypothetical protein
MHAANGGSWDVWITEVSVLYFGSLEIELRNGGLI